METIKIGTKVQLLLDILRNPINAYGICYETYDLGWGRGVSIIFENGEYDGFSKEEQIIYLKVVEHTNFTYNFQNVMKLSNDFNKGIFKELQ